MADAPVVAVFDTGVDPMHAIFRPQPISARRRVAITNLATLRRSFARGQPVMRSSFSQALDQLRWNPGVYPPLAAMLEHGRAFAGFSSADDSELPDEGTTVYADLDGHGTATCGVLASHGLVVLPIKIAYAVENAVSLTGLINACEWLLNRPAYAPTCEHAIWPFGSTDSGCASLFSELAHELKRYNIQVWASGRGAVENIDPPDQCQWPADCDEVIAVDEVIHLQGYAVTFDQEDWGVAYHVAASACPAPLLRADRRAVSQYDNVNHFEDDQNYITSGQRSVVLIRSDKPYVNCRQAVSLDVPVFSLDQFPQEWGTLTLRYIGEQIRASDVPSQGLRITAQTGAAVPVAYSISGYAPIYGPSIAAPFGFVAQRGLFRLSGRNAAQLPLI